MSDTPKLNVGALIKRLREEESCLQWPDLMDKAAAALESLRAERDAARELLRAVYEEINEEGPDGPGHCHSVPGVWDMDNRKDLRGKPCEWCALWNRVRAALAAKEGT